MDTFLVVTNLLAAVYLMYLVFAFSAGTAFGVFLYRLVPFCLAVVLTITALKSLGILVVI